MALVYLLVGACGIVQIALGIAAFVFPDHLLAHCWALFFLGATYAHLKAIAAAHGHVEPEWVVTVIATHALISVVLVALWLLSRRSSSVA